MKIACIQSNPQNIKEQNLAHLKESIFSAAKNGAQVIVLPEMYSYMGDESKRYMSADNPDSGAFLQMSKWALECGVYLVAGSHSELLMSDNSSDKKVFNTNFVYNKEGKIINKYQKIHLFNLRDAQGNALYCESDVFRPGQQVSTFEILNQETQKSWHCAVMICYDLRFPEIFRTPQIRAKPLDIIFLPAAFTHQTGQDHWEVLLRARAIENQCYVVACNQTGFFLEGKKRNYGHSLVVDPWGRVTAYLGEEVDTLYAQLSQDDLLAARTRLPALANRVL